MSTNPRAARPLHPAAWWLWAGGVAAAVMRTTNVLVLALLLVVVALVVANRRSDAPWARSFGSFLKLGAVVILIRLVIQVLFGARLGTTIVFSLPSVAVPDWLGGENSGISLGGDVSLESLVQSFAEGFRLAVLLACFGALNSLSSPYRMLRAMPAVLFEAGVAVSMAVAFAPEAVASALELREARRLRGRRSTGLRALRGVAVPVLEGALDRSVDLAASMDVRGYGRRGDVPASRRRLASASLLVGMLAACVGAYGLLDASAPRYLALPTVALAVVAMGATLLWKGARSPRTRYRPDPFAWPEWAVAASGAAAAAVMLGIGRVEPAALNPTFVPLGWPVLPTLAVLAAVLAGVPAVAAPPPPRLEPELAHVADAGDRDRDAGQDLEPAVFA